MRRISFVHIPRIDRDLARYLVIAAILTAGKPDILDAVIGFIQGWTP